MDKVTILNNHLEFKKTSVQSIGKLQDIERYLKKFLNSSNKPLSNFKEEDITKFINSLDYSIRTKNDIKTYIKVFVKWFYPDWSSRFRNLDRICKLQTPSKAYKPEQMISLDEIKKLIEGEQDLMYKVYWSVFFYGGFRPSECCRLQWNDIDFNEDGTTIKLHTTKTNRDFIKGIPQDVENLLRNWKEYNHSIWVFPSPINKDKPIIAKSICGRLKRLSKRVLQKDVVPYTLRHSVATILYSDDSRKDDDTANQLGHNKSMKNTYLNLDDDRLKTKARSLWIKTKPLTKEERDEIQKLREENQRIKRDVKKELKDFEKQLFEKFNGKLKGSKYIIVNQEEN